MEPTIYRFIFRHSARQQIALLALTAMSFPFLYFSLELPKRIVNQAINGSDFPRRLLGYEVDQIPYLLALCVIFLLLVLANGVFKYVINVYRGVVGERMLRRLRYTLFRRVLRFPLAQFRRVSQGELVAMITAETEPLGGYIGDSVALPAFQGGILITIMIFMFVQDPVLGAAAVALYPMQGWLIPKLQRRVNRLKKERVVLVRKLSERIGEVVSGIEQVHAHDTSRYELADFSARVGEIYEVRYQIYRQKFFIKFLNNFLAQVTPFFFYSIGGYLVIRGELSFGALVAVLTAYKDLSDPWKELLNFYQLKEDAKLRYELLLETFEPRGMLAESLQEGELEPDTALTGTLVASNLDLSDEDDGEGAFAGGLSLSLGLPAHVALLGTAGSGAERFARALAALHRPRRGALRIGPIDLLRAPEALTGRLVGYAGPTPALASGTLRDALVYSLKHRPPAPRDGDPEQRRVLRESRLSGNSEHDVHGDWIDYPRAAIAGPEALAERAIEVLELVDMADDVYQLGLQGRIDPRTRPELVERVLRARREVREWLQLPELASLVELFRADAYNTNMSVAENLLFGSPRDPSFDLENLGENAYVRKVLHETGLMEAFLDIGRQVAELMVDVFADVEPGSELFEQYSFIRAEDLPEFRSLLARLGSQRGAHCADEDRRRLLSLPFQLVVARHRLGLITDELQQRLLEARGLLARGFGAGSPPIEFFDPERYNPAISLQDNILFGRLAWGRPRAAQRVGALIGEVVDRCGLRRQVMEVGLDYPIGVGGARLGTQQRQKLALARCVIKRPDLLIVDGATAALDPATEEAVIARLRGELGERSLIWVLRRASLSRRFDEILVMEEGRVVERGKPQELERSGETFRALLQAG